MRSVLASHRQSPGSRLPSGSAATHWRETSHFIIGRQLVRFEYVLLVDSDQQVVFPRCEGRKLFDQCVAQLCDRRAVLQRERDNVLPHRFMCRRKEPDGQNHVTTSSSLRVVSSDAMLGFSPYDKARIFSG